MPGRPPTHAARRPRAAPCPPPPQQQHGANHRAHHRSRARIAAIAEPNAAVLARTNPFFFARLLRDGADRVWVPLQLDAHLDGIRREHLTPIAHDDTDRGWIRAPLTRPFAPEAAIAAIEVLCREGRPVYLSDQLELYVDFMPRLKAVLAERFGLTRVLAPEPYTVDRVDCP